MKTKKILTVIGMILFLAIRNSHAVAEYNNWIPNGTVTSCATCHVDVDPDQSGITTRNSFGVAFRATTPTQKGSVLNIDTMKGS